VAARAGADQPGPRAHRGPSGERALAGATAHQSAKRKLYDEGIAGQALVLKAPKDHAISSVEENIGRFTVRADRRR
jgi:hypothetical protein